MQHRGDHDIAFYEATIGETFRAQGVDDGGLSEVNDDAEGPLPPGRYLIQLLNASASDIIVWVHFGPFEKEESLSPASPTAPGPKRIPMSPGTVVAIETHVLSGVDDRIAAQTESGTVDVVATRVSTKVHKGA